MEARAGGGLGYHRVKYCREAKTLNLSSKAAEEEITCVMWLGGP